MWQWILLFIVLTPGVLFTIPPYGKKFVKGVSGTVVTAILHGVVFAAAAWFFMLCKEGFEGFQNLQGLLGLSSTCPTTQYTVPTCTPCPAGSSCNGETKTPCPSKEVAALGAGVCTPCFAEKVPNSDKSACISCSSGQVPNSDKTACIPQVICGAGEGGTGGVVGSMSGWSSTCNTCPAGTISVTLGQNSPVYKTSFTNKRCIPAPTSGGGAGSSSIVCQPGTGGIRSGQVGSYTWGTTCETCPAGTFSVNWTSSTQPSVTSKRCLLCSGTANGTRPYSNAGATGPGQCRANP